jgi:hypothetical protein
VSAVLSLPAAVSRVSNTVLFACLYLLIYTQYQVQWIEVAHQWLWLRMPTLYLTLAGMLPGVPIHTLPIATQHNFIVVVTSRCCALHAAGSVVGCPGCFTLSTAASRHSTAGPAPAAGVVLPRLCIRLGVAGS